MTISKLINNLLIVLTMLAFCAQLVIDFSTVNIATSTLILGSALLTLLYLRWTCALETHPLSSFAIFGFSFTTVIGAIWIQSATWLPVIKNLHQPFFTFSWLALFQAVSILAHMVYRNNRKSSRPNQPSFLTSLFDSMSIYAIQPVSVIWLMGLIGLFGVLLAKIFPVANGLSFLAWMPFLIPINYLLIGKSYCNIKVHFIFIVFQILIIGLLGIFFNSRGLLFSGIYILILIFAFRAMRSQALVSSVMLFRSLSFLILAVAISQPVSNIVTAMAIEKTNSGRVSPIRIIENTFNNYNNPKKLESYRNTIKNQSEFSRYEERYIDNPVLARLVTTKFHDNALYFADRISDNASEEIMRISVRFLYTAFPQPFLDILKIDIQKDSMKHSMGDLLSHYSVGTPLGGYRTGSVFGQGLLLFGNYFIIIYFAICIIMFAAIDIFSKATTEGVIVFSAIGILNLGFYFGSGITAESLHALFIGGIRGVLQPVVLYFIILSIAKFITRFFSFNVNSKQFLGLK
jgi:hypothetical protein